jgi:monovalent cation/hydrogen antiporter
MLLTIQILILLLVVVAAVAVLAARLRIPPAILLVLTGVALALFPNLPNVELAPDLVLLLVLPPLIYASAVAMSWREFRFNLRPISLLAFGCVIFTAIAVAAATHWLLGVSWPVGFVIGAIVSPPDAVAPLSIARRMELPRRILVVLEGEGLANDATALLLYRFAVTAASVGSFSLSSATTTFVAIVVGEIIWGIGVGWFMLRLRRWVADPSIEILLSVLTPFIAYWPPEMLGGSGVLATVATGLFISWNGLYLISAATRLQGIFFWEFLVYLIEGMVFLMTGLQARTLLSRIGGYSSSDLATSAAIVSAVVIVARFLWIYPAVYLPRWLFPAIRRSDPSPPWQWPFALAFTGVRGIVSLAAALAIPFTTTSGEPFPDRNLILFLTFSVILITLVGQGLLLPTVIRALGLANAGRQEHLAARSEAQEARRAAVNAAIDRLDELIKKRELAEEITQSLQAHHRDRLRRLERRSSKDTANQFLSKLHDEIELLMIDAERHHINKLSRGGRLNDESRRRIERELDLREAHLAQQKDDL